MLNKIVKIDIPEVMFSDFLDFLDSAQGVYTTKDLEEMAPFQRNLIMFIRKKFLPARGHITQTPQETPDQFQFEDSSEPS
jgi:hypothetical protein